jgi:hypothetical protein
MSDEFDEFTPTASLGARARPRAGAAGPRLVARLFAAAGVPLRMRLLHCLMRPLGPLGAAGVASGAFAAFAGPAGSGQHRFDAEAVARLSSRQVRELAQFVEQVDPQALRQFASVAANSPLALARCSAPVLALLYRRLQPEAPGRAATFSTPAGRHAAAPRPPSPQSAGPAVAA